MEFPDGSFAIDHIEDLIHVQEVFMETVSEIRKVNMFTYPVLTFCILKKPGLTDADREAMMRNRQWDLFVDDKFARWASKHNMQWYDSNFFLSDNVGTLSNCCRLLSDTSKLDAFINSIGGTALSVGSCRVSTINLARIAYEALGYDKNVNVDLTKIDLEKAKQRYLKILEERTLLDCKALFSMRHILKRNIEKGLLPNYCDGGVELDKQFCTIGAIAAYEVMDLFGLIQTDEFDNKSYSDGAVEFMTQILDTINRVKDSFDCDYSMNLECIPGENCAGVICQADNLLFRQSRYFIYSNQWIPLMAKCTLQEKCRLGHLFDEKCGGGTIAHINVENRFPNEQAAWDMLNYVAASGVIYSAFTTKINVCEHKHASIGTSTCPECGGPIVDQFARVVGFYVPISSYQKIRKREFDLRKWYNVLESERLF